MSAIRNVRSSVSGTTRTPSDEGASSVSLTAGSRGSVTSSSPPPGPHECTYSHIGHLSRTTRGPRGRPGYDLRMAGLTIRDVPGIRVGHWTDAERGTGCTTVLAPDEGALAGVDVRGSAPGTRETDLLRPTALVERVNAICLAGGSAFGLAAA